MIDNGLVLREAWRSAFATLGVGDGDAVVMGGPGAEMIAEVVPLGVVDAVSGIVSLGASPSLDPSAGVSSTGLPAGSIDVVVMLSGWRDPVALGSVAAEARRIIRPGGAAHLGVVDIDALVDTPIARRTSSLLYGPHADAIFGTRVPGVGVAAPALLLQRSGFRSVRASSIDLPLGAFSDVDAYLKAVRGGLWFGIDRVTAHERDRVLEAARRWSSGSEFPMIEYQPWRIASGTAAA
jgi:hypothetical protein